MLDELETHTPEPAEAVDPYDGVALGVECAWPQHLTPAEAAAEQQ